MAQQEGWRTLASRLGRFEKKNWNRSGRRGTQRESYRSAAARRPYELKGTAFKGQ